MGRVFDEAMELWAGLYRKIRDKAGDSGLFSTGRAPDSSAAGTRTVPAGQERFRMKEMKAWDPDVPREHIRRCLKKMKMDSGAVPETEWAALQWLFQRQKPSGTGKPFPVTMGFHREGDLYEMLEVLLYPDGFSEIRFALVSRIGNDADRDDRPEEAVRYMVSCPADPRLLANPLSAADALNDWMREACRRLEAMTAGGSGPAYQAARHLWKAGWLWRNPSKWRTDLAGVSLSVQGAREWMAEAVSGAKKRFTAETPENEPFFQISAERGSVTETLAAAVCRRGGADAPWREHRYQFTYRIQAPDGTAYTDRQWENLGSPRRTEAGEWTEKMNRWMAECRGRIAGFTLPHSEPELRAAALKLSGGGMRLTEESAGASFAALQAEDDRCFAEYLASPFELQKGVETYGKTGSVFEIWIGGTSYGLVRFEETGVYKFVIGYMHPATGPNNPYGDWCEIRSEEIPHDFPRGWDARRLAALMTDSADTRAKLEQNGEMQAFFREGRAEKVPDAAIRDRSERGYSPD